MNARIPLGTSNVLVALMFVGVVGLMGCGGLSKKVAPRCGTDASVSAVLSLDGGSSACLACVRTMCTAKIQACESDCVCNDTAEKALVCLERLPTSASVAAVGACVSGLASSPNAALGQVGTCLASCELSCATPADGGGETTPEVGGVDASDAGVDLPASEVADAAAESPGLDAPTEAPGIDAAIVHPAGGPAFYVLTTARLAAVARGGALADFDEDGKLDLALAGSDTTGSPGAVIALGDGVGGFAYETTVAGMGTTPEGIVAGDFNRDNHQDIVVAGFSEGPFIAFGKGDGTFKPAVSLASGSPSGGGLVNAGDFNNDGALDIAVGFNGGLFVLLNDGQGGFLSPPVRANSQSVFDTFAVGDVNNDKLPDIGYGDNTLWLVTNDGPSADGGVADGGAGDGGTPTVTFTGSNLVSSGPNTRHVAFGDLDKNGHLDVVVTNAGGNPAPLSVFLQRTNGTFMPQIMYGTTPDGPPVVADFDNDTNPDVATSTSGQASSVVFYRGDGAGGLGSPVNYPLGASASFILSADINKNGKPDIVAVSSGVVATTLLQ